MPELVFSPDLPERERSIGDNLKFLNKTLPLLQIADHIISLELVIAFLQIFFFDCKNVFVA